MKLRMALALASSAALAFVFACSSSTSSTPSTASFAGSCRELASRCHPVKSALGTECHDLGHDGDDAKCGPRRAECLAECPEADAAAGHGHGDDDHDNDQDAGDDASTADAGGPSAACKAYCACMTATCTTAFADEPACLAKCATFSEADRECFGGHCEAAKTAADKEHDCEHASGASACH